MPKSPEKNEVAPLVPEPTVTPAPDAAQKAAETAVETDNAPSADPRDRPAVPNEETAPDVKVQLSQDYKNLVDSLAENDENRSSEVYVHIAELPEDLRAAKDEDRFLVPSEPTTVPAAVARQLADSPAVEVVE